MERLVIRRQFAPGQRVPEFHLVVDGRPKQMTGADADYISGLSSP